MCKTLINIQKKLSLLCFNVVLLFASLVFFNYKKYIVVIMDDCVQNSNKHHGEISQAHCMRLAKSKERACVYRVSVRAFFFCD